MARTGVTLLCCVLLAAAGGLHFCCGIDVLEGLTGQSLSFPTLHYMSADIVRVTWMFQGTHIAEAKPREKKFTVNYLPKFHSRLLIHPANLSLEIRALMLEDRGIYDVVVNTSSAPTNPKIFSYLLLVHHGSSETAARTGDTGGHSGSTMRPQGVTEPCSGDATTQRTGGGQPPSSGEGTAACGVQSHYCVVKTYLMATVFVPLLMLVVTIHIMTRDKAAEPGGQVLAGLRVESEPCVIAAAQGLSLQQ